MKPALALHTNLQSERMRDPAGACTHRKNANVFFLPGRTSSLQLPKRNAASFQDVAKKTLGYSGRIGA